MQVYILRNTITRVSSTKYHDECYPFNILHIFVYYAHFWTFKYFVNAETRTVYS